MIYSYSSRYEYYQYSHTVVPVRMSFMSKWMEIVKFFSPSMHTHTSFAALAYQLWLQVFWLFLTCENNEISMPSSSDEERWGEAEESLVARLDWVKAREFAQYQHRTCALGVVQSITSSTSRALIILLMVWLAVMLSRRWLQLQNSSSIWRHCWPTG